MTKQDMIEVKSIQPKRGKTALRILVVIALVIVIDQITKYLAVSFLSQSNRINIIPGCFDLTLTFNKGVAFGLFSSIENNFLRHVILGITTIVALAAVIYFFMKELSDSLSGQIAFAMIVGGAIGNLLDRIRLGQVVDFFLAYYDEYHWPVFNMADSCISVGVALLLLFNWKSEKKRT
ncbi:MAG: signal peptidase II [SAR324 cluster bacterium]|uniref:Lipoprotein signal peptidase n=1 Tax=SAR324 cluster bacterium TaxID=2024889 RepID=A0A7X9FSM1_9DELT|nr:signal peptidase II [SAR324 cluster bacterium]